MNVWLLVSMGWRARVKADMAKPVHYHTVHQVDRLPGPRKIHLCPVVLRRGGVGVAGGRGGGYSSVSEYSFKYWHFGTGNRIAFPFNGIHDIFSNGILACWN